MNYLTEEQQVASGEGNCRGLGDWGILLLPDLDRGDSGKLLAETKGLSSPSNCFSTGSPLPLTARKQELHNPGSSSWPPPSMHFQQKTLPQLLQLLTREATVREARHAWHITRSRLPFIRDSKEMQDLTLRNISKTDISATPNQPKLLPISKETQQILPPTTLPWVSFSTRSLQLTH